LKPRARGLGQRIIGPIHVDEFSVAEWLADATSRLDGIEHVRKGDARFASAGRLAHCRERTLLVD